MTARLWPTTSWISCAIRRRSSAPRRSASSSAERSASIGARQQRVRLPAPGAQRLAAGHRRDEPDERADDDRLRPAVARDVHDRDRDHADEGRPDPDPALRDGHDAHEREERRDVDRAVAVADGQVGHRARQRDRVARVRPPPAQCERQSRSREQDVCKSVQSPCVVLALDGVRRDDEKERRQREAQRQIAPLIVVLLHDLRTLRPHRPPRIRPRAQRRVRQRAYERADVAWVPLEGPFRHRRPD